MRFRRYGMPFLSEPRARVRRDRRAPAGRSSPRACCDPPREREVLRALQLGWFTTHAACSTRTMTSRGARARQRSRRRGGRRRDRRRRPRSPPTRTTSARRARPQGGPTDFQGKARQTDGPVRYSAPSLVFESERRPAPRGRRLSDDRGLRRADRQPRPHARAPARRPSDAARGARGASPPASSPRRSPRSWRRTTRSPTAIAAERALIELLGAGEVRRDRARRRRPLADRLSAAGRVPRPRARGG